MTIITVQLPDESAQRLEVLAEAKGLTTSELVEQMMAVALSSLNAEAEFSQVARTASVPAALAVLDRLDRDAGASE